MALSERMLRQIARENELVKFFIELGEADERARTEAVDALLKSGAITTPEEGDEAAALEELARLDFDAMVRFTIDHQDSPHDVFMAAAKELYEAAREYYDGLTRKEKADGAVRGETSQTPEKSR